MATEIHLVDGRTLLAADDYSTVSDEFGRLRGGEGTIRVTQFGNEIPHVLNAAHIVSLQERTTQD